MSAQGVARIKAEVAATVVGNVALVTDPEDFRLALSCGYGVKLSRFTEGQVFTARTALENGILEVKDGLSDLCNFKEVPEVFFTGQLTNFGLAHLEELWDLRDDVAKTIEDILGWDSVGSNFEGPFYVDRSRPVCSIRHKLTYRMDVPPIELCADTPATLKVKSRKHKLNEAGEDVIEPEAYGVSTCNTIKVEQLRAVVALTTNMEKQSGGVILHAKKGEGNVKYYVPMRAGEVLFYEPEDYLLTLLAPSVACTKERKKVTKTYLSNMLVLPITFFRVDQLTPFSRDHTVKRHLTKRTNALACRRTSGTAAWPLENKAMFTALAKRYSQVVLQPSQLSSMPTEEHIYWFHDVDRVSTRQLMR